MTRFNYLGQSLPGVVDRVRGTVIPEHLRTPLCALVTSILAVGVWCAIEGTLQRHADVEVRVAQQRLTTTRETLAKLRIEKKNVDTVLALDRQLRDIRLSGSILSSQLVDIANRMPAHAWLVSLDRGPKSLDIAGIAPDLQTLSGTVSGLNGSRAFPNPTLVRATKDERGNAPAFISFEVRAGAEP